jgi:hypothetical protein
MFDFMDSDEFIIGLEILFLIFIYFDVKKYILIRKKEYLLNIVLTIGLFIYALNPLYNKYYKWGDLGKQEYNKQCLSNENNLSLCSCLNDKIFKKYTEVEYSFLLSQQDDALKDFLNKEKEECLK